jgi:hypothetical protein
MRIRSAGNFLFKFEKVHLNYLLVGRELFEPWRQRIRS